MLLFKLLGLCVQNVLGHVLGRQVQKIQETGPWSGVVYQGFCACHVFFGLLVFEANQSPPQSFSVALKRHSE